MAAYNKFNVFLENSHEGLHNLASHTLKVLLTNTAPVATNTVKANLTEIAAGYGYVAGGAQAVVNSSASVAGVYKLKCDNVTFTAAGGSIGPFRYAVLYNDTPTGDPLIAWWDRGSSLTIIDGESFAVNFDQTAGVFTNT